MNPLERNETSLGELLSDEETPIVRSQANREGFFAQSASTSSQYNPVGNIAGGEQPLSGYIETNPCQRNDNQIQTALQKLLSDQTNDETSSVRSQANRGGISTPNSSTSSQGNPVSNIAGGEQLLFGSECRCQDKPLNDLLDQILFGKPIANEPDDVGSQIYCRRITALSTSLQENQPRSPINQSTTNIPDQLFKDCSITNLLPSHSNAQMVYGPDNPTRRFSSAYEGSIPRNNARTAHGPYQHIQFPSTFKDSTPYNNVQTAYGPNTPIGLSATHKYSTAASRSSHGPKSPSVFSEQGRSINQPTITNTPNADKSALLWRKLDFSIQMIASLESVNGVDAIEADIRYNHLTGLYQSFVSNVDEIMHHVHVPSADFNRLIKAAKEMQQRVISIQVSLKKIILNVSPSSTASKVNDQTDRTTTERHDFKTVPNSQASTSRNRSFAKVLESVSKSTRYGQNDLAKSDSDPVVTKKARTDADVSTEQMLKPDQSSTELPSNITGGDSTRKNIERGKSNDEPAVAETAQHNDLVNKTKSMSLDDTFSKSMETNDQANQTTQPENNAQAILACVEKQKVLLNALKLMESLRGPGDWKMAAEQALSLHQSFISNQNEFEKYLNPSHRKLEQDFTHKVVNRLRVLQLNLKLFDARQSFSQRE
ncbi:uncharacterized protein LOC135843795 isoform X2 [Planococcus citri]|uniref:uncharacterized protein LOC135843795 isoform X2 n=1 Tax=Planococcus citri TaxID=170843 RepID=UPI0031F9A50D